MYIVSQCVAKKNEVGMGRSLDVHLFHYFLQHPFLLEFFL